MHAIGQGQQALHGRSFDGAALALVLAQIVDGVDQPPAAGFVIFQSSEEPVEEALAAAGERRSAVQRRLQPAAQAAAGHPPARQPGQAGVGRPPPQLQPVQVHQIGCARGGRQAVVARLPDQLDGHTGLGQPAAQQINVGVGLAQRG